MTQPRTPGPPDPLDFDLRLGHALRRAEQALAAEKTRALRTVDLTLPQYLALYTLHRSTGLSGAQLARACAVTPQTMATVLANLEHKGLITREPSSVHQKVLVTRPTRPGRTLAKKADTLVRAVERRLAAAYRPAELDRLRELLERASTALHPDGPPAAPETDGRGREPIR